MKYPVLVIDNVTREIGCFSEPLKSCMLDAVNIYKNNILVDTEGKKFKIVDTKILGWASWLDYLNLYKYRSVKIDMTIIEDGSISIEELKALLIGYLKSGWTFLLPHPESIEEWGRRISTSETHLEIIHLLMYDFD